MRKAIIAIITIKAIIPTIISAIAFPKLNNTHFLSYMVSHT